MSDSHTAGHGDDEDESIQDPLNHQTQDWLEWLRDQIMQNNEDDDDDADEEIGFEIVIEGPAGASVSQGQPGRPFLTPREFLALLRGRHLHHMLGEDDDGHDTFGRGDADEPPQFPKVPSDEGRKLMDSGVFGAYDRRESRESKRKVLPRRLMERELGLRDPLGQRINQGLMAQSMIPSQKAEVVIHYDDPVCCGQFSDDGNFFYACVKDFKVRMYDTSSPYNWKHYKTVTYPSGQWTMTDAALSPDNKWLAFSSLQSHVGIAATDPNDTGDPYSLDLADGLTTSNNAHSYILGGFPIFSVRFSGDGRHLVAGTGTNSIVVYDIERRKTLHHVRGHADDVNAVCFADRSSPHILYSGSDDCTIKVWDTRSLGDGREAGAFVGHVEGLTYIDSKGDGRYILSNAKDQSMKLWDLRMAMSAERFREVRPTRVTDERDYEYDYRWQDYEDYQWFRHPHDNSLVTFRGHKVQRTLIRCHFSPPNSTDSRYVYSGSYDGFVYVWNLDATLAAKIDVKAATEARARPRLERRHHRLRRRHGGGEWEALVRDVGWHPNAPVLVASSWSGVEMDGGTASLHSFNEGDDDEGEPSMGIPVNEKLEPILSWR